MEVNQVERKPETGRQQMGDGEFPMLRITLCVLLCLGALACRMYAPGGAAKLGEYVLGGERTEAAFAALAESVSEGTPVVEAFSTFYEELEPSAAP